MRTQVFKNVFGKGIESNGMFDIMHAFRNFLKEYAVTVQLTVRRLTFV
jgi:hypothetical protein